MADQDSPAERRTRLQGCFKRLSECDDKNDMIEEIRTALSVPPPDGSPDVLDHLADTYRRQADAAEEVGNQVGTVGKSRLPEIWAGESGARAAETVTAAARDADHMAQAFRGGYKALAALADAVREAQATDGVGREQLYDALRILGPADGFFDGLYDDDAEKDAIWQAGSAATAGAEKRYTAAGKVEEAGHVAARDLNHLASQARAGRLRGSGLSDADALVLADTAVAGAPHDLNELLSVDDLKRSEEALSRLKGEDRDTFDRMLADARSPEERAYLVKALAAGNNMDAVSSFQEKIHGHDPLWLRDHLSPVVTAADSMDDEGVASGGANHNTDDVTFHGQKWIQGGDGSEGTCVASSTITARAMVDPVYALDLTGGPSGHDENPEDFRDRLVDEQHRVHEEGDGGDNWNGMGIEGQETVDDREIGSHTGTDYEPRALSSADDRRAALTDVERSVADGRPVPVDVSGDAGAHAMMIIGQDGDKLQIYNPWGTTTWVSEDDFVNGHMGKASENGLDDAYVVLLPQ